MNYFIKIHSPNKAKNDIDDIVTSLGYSNLNPWFNRPRATDRFFAKICSTVHILARLQRGDTLFLQYPLKKFFNIICHAAHLKGAKVITVIHDLSSFHSNRCTPQEEADRLSDSDAIIVHNPRMMETLRQYGCTARLTSLDIFDYLSGNYPPSKSHQPHTPRSVVYAGALGRRKNEFLYKIDPNIQNWQLDIYGNGFEPEYAKLCKHISYHGFIDSEQFVSKIDADFGLVWDGDSISECSGRAGTYLKINNPHKTSFYLRSHLPVIVWDQAAMAQFITDNNIGIAIKSLTELNEKLNAISDEQYQQMKANVAKISTLLGDGHYIKRAISAALNTISDHEQQI